MQPQDPSCPWLPEKPFGTAGQVRGTGLFCSAMHWHPLMTVMYIQWMPGSLAAVLPTMLALTGALLAGILEASAGQGHKLGSPFFCPALLQIFSLSSPRCNFPGRKQGPCKTARSVCVYALLLPGAVSARTLFPSLSAPGPKPAVVAPALLEQESW